MQALILLMVARHCKRKAAALADLSGQLGRQHKGIAVIGSVDQALVVGVAKGICKNFVQILISPFCQRGQMAQLCINRRCQCAHQRSIIQLDDRIACLREILLDDVIQCI